MGLDMYLKASKYVNKLDYKTDPPVNEPEYNALAALYPALDNGLIYGFEISRTVAYWRKANQIHRWFVRNVQGGEDDCKDYYVERDQLVELVDLCKEVLANRDKADDLLETQAGFFFGGTDYDEYYFGDLQDTVDQLTKLLNDPNLNDFDLYYTSSW